MSGSTIDFGGSGSTTTQQKTVESTIHPLLTAVGYGMDKEIFGIENEDYAEAVGVVLRGDGTPDSPGSLFTNCETVEICETTLINIEITAPRKWDFVYSTNPDDEWPTLEVNDKVKCFWTEECDFNQIPVDGGDDWWEGGESNPNPVHQYEASQAFQDKMNSCGNVTGFPDLLGTNTLLDQFCNNLTMIDQCDVSLSQFEGILEIFDHNGMLDNVRECLCNATNQNRHQIDADIISYGKFLLSGKFMSFDKFKEVVAFRNEYDIELDIEALANAIVDNCGLSALGEPMRGTPAVSFDAPVSECLVDIINEHSDNQAQDEDCVENAEAALAEINSFYNLDDIRYEWFEKQDCDFIIEFNFIRNSVNGELSRVEAFYELFTQNGFDPLSIKPDVNDFVARSVAGNSNEGCEPFTPTVAWDVTGHLKTNLLNKYRLDIITRNYIRDNFPREVLGPGFEAFMLNSLGIESNTRNVGGAVPDGINGQEYSGHIFEYLVEVKMVSNTQVNNPIFDWSAQANQLPAYLNYLESNLHRNHETMLGGVYLIVPANVSVATDLIQSASNRNISFYVSEAEVCQDRQLIKVSDPEWKNVDQINISGHFFDFLGKGFFEYANKRNFKERYFQYNEVSYDFEPYAEAFDRSHLPR